VKNPELLRQFAMPFRRGEAAAKAIEYCLIAGGMGLAIFGAVKLLGSDLTPIFVSVATLIR